MAVFCIVATCPAFAADTVIGFDDLVKGTVVTNQYSAKGITFPSSPADVVTTDPKASSPPNVMDIEHHGSEFQEDYEQGVFSNAHHQHVSVRVGSQSGFGGPVTLTLYDLGQNPIATASATVTGGSTPVLLSAAAAHNNAASFTIDGGYNTHMWIDDLDFDTVAGATQADFSLSSASRVSMPPGGQGSATIILGRYDGSTGSISLSVSGLPKGVTQTVSPNPTSGPNGSTISVSFFTALGSLPTGAVNVTITGTPSSTAGKYGSHSVVIPVDVQDLYDAKIVGMEVSQGVQNYDLDGAGSHAATYTGVPLAVGSKTIVRVFVNITTFPTLAAVPIIGCSLYGTRGGVLLVGSPLSAQQSPTALYVGPSSVSDAVRAKGQAYIFALPDFWAQGTIILQARITPAPVFSPPIAIDTNATDDVFTLSGIAFTPTRDLFMCPISLTVSNYNGGAVDPPATVYAEARNLLPVVDGHLYVPSYQGTIDITDIWNETSHPCGYSTCPTVDTDRASEASARLRDRADDWGFNDGTSLIVGIQPGDQYQQPIRGLTSSDCTGPFYDCDSLTVAEVQHRDRPLTSAAHEFGHELGRKHASAACGADNAQNWPPDQMGYLEGVGLDRRDFTVKFPDRNGETTLGGPFYDFMSYCGSNGPGNEGQTHWISTRGWTDTINLLATGPAGHGVVVSRSAMGEGPDEYWVGNGVHVIAGAPQAEEPATQVRTPAEDLVPILNVQAIVRINGDISITKVAPESGVPMADVPASPYHLVVLNSDGVIISNTGMRASLAHIDDAPDSSILTARVAVSGAATVEIVANGMVVDRRVRPTSPPVVTGVTVKPDVAMTAGTFTTISWKASSPGNLPLMVKVDYSPDGGQTWKPVYFGHNTGQAILQSGFFQASTAGLARVRASDGFNETTAESPMFTAKGVGPDVRILSPRPGEQSRSAAALYLSGEAYDDRGMPIGGSQMEWLANNLSLGTGASLSVANLAPGTWTITLRATDWTGRLGSTSLEVTITGCALPLITCHPDISVSSASGTCSAQVDISPATSSSSGVLIHGARSDGKQVAEPYPVGVTTITWTVVNPCGDSATCTQRVTVSDKEPPVLTCSPGTTVEAAAGQCGATVSVRPPPVTDNCGVRSVVGARSDGMHLTDPYPVGVTAIVWAATDEAGNTAVCSTTVTVTGNAPTITCPPDVTVTVTAGSNSATVGMGKPVATNACAGVVGVRRDGLALTAPFPIGDTPITWIAVGLNGKYADCVQHVIVKK